MVGSPEYFQTRGGGNHSRFVAALYQDALNRTADAGGQAGFIQALANGISRTQIAAVIVTSGEHHGDWGQSYYQTYLRRPADSGDLNMFSNLLAQRMSDHEVIAFIMGSAEYLARLG